MKITKSDMEEDKTMIPNPYQIAQMARKYNVIIVRIEIQHARKGRPSDPEMNSIKHFFMVF